MASLPAFSKPVNLGAENIDGVTTWHVQVKSVPPAKPAAGKVVDVITVDLYAVQSDLTLRRVTVSDQETSKGATTSLGLNLDLTKYGEPVSVTLPAACSGTKVSGKAGAVERKISALFGGRFDPLQLLGRLAAHR